MAPTVSEQCPPEVIVEDMDPRRLRQKVLVRLDSSAKSHRIKGAVIQIIFLAKKCETRLCKDVLDKERDLLAHMTVVLLHMQLQIKFANR